MASDHRSPSPDETTKVINAESLIDASDSPTECAHHIPARNFLYLPLVPVEHMPVETPDGSTESAYTKKKKAESRAYSQRRDSVSSSASFGLQRFLKLCPVQPGEPDFALVE